MKLSLSYLSKYRAQLMGLAAIFIMLCHSTVVLSGNAHIIYQTFIRRFMQCGVDIFLLVSGLGCYFSFEKNPSSISFYKKRLIRILIPYIIFATLYGIFSCCFLKVGILSHLYYYSIINFFISGSLGTWFVAAIITLYLIFPLVYRLLKKNPNSIIIIAGIIIILVLIPFWQLLPEPIQVVRETFFTRIPVFLIGAWIGKQIYEKKDISINTVLCVLVLVFSVAIFTINSLFNDFDAWTYSRLLFLPISLSLSVILTNLYHKFKVEKYAINGFFLFWGSLSFELYLAFERVNEFLSVYLPTPGFIFKYISPSLFSIIVNVISAIIAIIIAIVVHKLSQLILSFPKKRKRIPN